MNFNLSVSDQGFDEKPKNYSKITFTQQNITLSQMVEVIRNGHLFCGIMQDSCFPINYKVSEHFVGTNVVSIDIDDCDCSMRDFMSTLSYTPSIAYETFSMTFLTLVHTDVYIVPFARQTTLVSLMIHIQAHHIRRYGEHQRIRTSYLWVCYIQFHLFLSIWTTVPFQSLI